MRTPTARVDLTSTPPQGDWAMPTWAFGEDPRANPKLLAAVSPMGMDKFSTPAGIEKLDENSTLDDMTDMISKFEEGIGMIYDGMVPLDLPGDDKEPKIDMKEETIKGGDGQDMKVYVYRPADQGDAKLPAVVYTHGGGMVINSTYNQVHERWCKSIAVHGCVVAMPDFRNAWTKTGYNHYPKGLNDCVAAVKWISSNRDSLKIKNIVLTGESGGANLACATALKANKEGWVKDIAGVYASVPYISNMYGASEEWKLKNLPSLVENHGYFLNSWANAYLGYFYTPNDKDAKDPLAWPYWATEEDMKGLPPHVLAMDECDPLRDEGVSYARRLAKAGVHAKGHVNLGVLHGTALLFRQSLPEYHNALAREVAAFAKEV